MSHVVIIGAGPAGLAAAGWLPPRRLRYNPLDPGAPLGARPRPPPDFDPAATTLRWMHSLDVRAEHVASSRRLLVVGGGASAADVLEGWLRVRRPDDRAQLALRSPLRTLPHFLLGLDFHYFS